PAGPAAGSALPAALAGSALPAGPAAGSAPPAGPAALGPSVTLVARPATPRYLMPAAGAPAGRPESPGRGFARRLGFARIDAAVLPEHPAPGCGPCSSIRGQ